MPTDSNGVYSLPDGYLAVTGTPILASQHNPPLEDLASSMTQRLMTSGVNPMTGPFKADDGSAAAPSVTFASAPDTGLFKSDTGIGVSVDGVKTGDLRFQLPIGLGPLPWSGASVPAGWVLCYGQTLSRAAYPDLWTFAQAEIAATNTLYNNGDGSTTFGIPDMRGRVAAGPDNMGGVSANRLPGFSIWALGGAATHTLAVTELPAHTHSGTTGNDSPDHTHAEDSFMLSSGQFAPGTGGAANTGSNTAGRFTGGASARHTHIFTTDNGTGSGGAHNNVQPTAALNSILFAGA